MKKITFEARTSYDPDDVVDETTAAEMLGMSRSMLIYLRHDGRGPKYTVANKRQPRYRVEDIVAYALQHLRVSVHKNKGAQA